MYSALIPEYMGAHHLFGQLSFCNALTEAVWSDIVHCRSRTRKKHDNNAECKSVQCSNWKTHMFEAIKEQTVSIATICASPWFQAKPRCVSDPTGLATIFLKRKLCMNSTVRYANINVERDIIDSLANLHGMVSMATVDKRPLAVRQGKLVVCEVNELSVGFILHHKLCEGTVLLGFQDHLSKLFLFSAPSGQAVFHGRCGGISVYAYRFEFSYGQEFVIFPSGLPGYFFVQAHCNGRFWRIEDEKRSSNFGEIKTDALDSSHATPFAFHFFRSKN